MEGVRDMKCPVCGVEMLLDRRDREGKAIYDCRNPQCERFKKKKEA